MGTVEDVDPDDEELDMVEDSFEIAGPWMKTQLNAVSDMQEGWDEPKTLTRWELWERNLRKVSRP